VKPSSISISHYLQHDCL